MSSTDRDDARLSDRDKSQSRKDRASEDRPVTENRQVIDKERLELFKSAIYQSTLPPTPEIPGYHTCWLTTTNPRDSIEHRRRLGYEPVRPAEAPGFDHSTIKTGEYSGCIGVNEMVAYKLPLELYELYMTEAHHNAPLMEEQKLKAVIETIAEEARTRGADLEVGEGSAELGSGAKRPKFEGLGR